MLCTSIRSLRPDHKSRHQRHIGHNMVEDQCHYDNSRTQETKWCHTLTEPMLLGDDRCNLEMCLWVLWRWITIYPGPVVSQIYMDSWNKSSKMTYNTCLRLANGTTKNDLLLSYQMLTLFSQFLWFWTWSSSLPTFPKFSSGSQWHGSSRSWKREQLIIKVQVYVLYQSTNQCMV